MELVAYGPVDRLFEVIHPTPAPGELPQVEVLVESSGFKFTWVHLALATGVLVLAGVVIWKVRQEKNKKKLFNT